MRTFTLLLLLIVTSPLHDADGVVGEWQLTAGPRNLKEKE
jgi:hypothetical protein